MTFSIDAGLSSGTLQQPFQVLTVPGWQGSGAGHWQTLWEASYGDQRVEQHDWMHPLRGDWMLRIEEVVLESRAPVLLACHSLGCIAAAWWAMHSRNTHRVHGALMVAPADVEQSSAAERFALWRPIALQPLPFASCVVSSCDDVFCSEERARFMANAWGSDWIDAGAQGHLNAESGLGVWPQGRAWLHALGHQLQAKE